MLVPEHTRVACPLKLIDGIIQKYPATDSIMMVKLGLLEINGPVLGTKKLSASSMTRRILSNGDSEETNRG